MSAVLPVRGINERPSNDRKDAPEAPTMSDFILLTTAIGFFLLAIAFTRGCEKLRGGDIP